MARLVIKHSVGARTDEFVVETTHLVSNEEEFHEALSGALPSVKTESMREIKEAIWESFLEHYEIVQAVYDQPEPPDYSGATEGDR